MQTLTLGILAGLTNAFFSALSYLLSRHHGQKHRGGSFQLLVLAHVLMGIICIPISWILLPDQLPKPEAWLPPLVYSAVAYLSGQTALFFTLRRIHASQLAPLLGLKVAVLALIVSFVLGHPLSGIQWFAVMISIIAATLLHTSGASAPRHAVLMVIGICLCFAIADLLIIELIDVVSHSNHLPHSTQTTMQNRIWASGFAMTTTYVLCGLIVTPLLFFMRQRTHVGWPAAFQYASAWMIAMVAHYTCFGLVGAVFGTILQSTRGVMAIGLGACLASMGWHDLEQLVDQRTLIRRIIAALMMTAAIAIYALA
ncbi:MAG: DMT family transporter [Pirellulales bacterium]